MEMKREKIILRRNVINHDEYKENRKKTKEKIE